MTNTISAARARAIKADAALYQEAAYREHRFTTLSLKHGWNDDAIAYQNLAYDYYYRAQQLLTELISSTVV